MSAETINIKWRRCLPKQSDRNSIQHLYQGAAALLQQHQVAVALLLGDRVSMWREKISRLGWHATC
jgi:hypothetical protein